MRNLIALSAALACLSGAAWGQAQQAGQCSFTPTGTGVVSCGVPMPITTPAFGSGVFTFKGLSSNGAVSIQTAPDNGRATGPTWSTAGAASADGSVSVNLVGVNAVQILVTATGSTPVNVSWLFQSQAASTTPGAPGSGGAVTASPPAATFAAGTAYVVTTGGTAVTMVTGPVNGGYIGNPLSASDQNIATAEVAYVNPVGTAALNGRGQNSAIQPGGYFTFPKVAAGSSISVNAATSGHAFNVVVW